MRNSSQDGDPRGRYEYHQYWPHQYPYQTPPNGSGPAQQFPLYPTPGYPIAGGDNAPYYYNTPPQGEQSMQHYRNLVHRNQNASNILVLKLFIIYVTISYIFFISFCTDAAAIE